MASPMAGVPASNLIQNKININQDKA